MTDNQNFDVIIIGGSYSGLSAAMALGRSLRRVLIIDSGKPCNAQTPHSHNFITNDGKTPKEISTQAKLQVLKYGTVKFYEGMAEQGKKKDNGYEVTTQNGDAFLGKKLILATGIKDVLPAIKGLSDCWGISVVHCPYCHGYEFRNQKTAIMANGEKAFHLASLVNNLTKNITLLTSGKPDFNEAEITRLNKHHISIIETEVHEMEHENGHIKNIVFKDGNKIQFDVLYAGIPFKQHSNIPVSLGCELTDKGYIRIDNFHKTTIDGVFACGDNSAMMRSVANAVYTGNYTGAMVNKELTDEQF